MASVHLVANMDAGEDQNTGTTNGNPQTSGNSRTPQIAHMSLYERQAVQVCLVVKSINIFSIPHTIYAFYSVKKYPSYKETDLHSAQGCTDFNIVTNVC